MIGAFIDLLTVLPSLGKIKLLYLVRKLWIVAKGGTFLDSEEAEKVSVYETDRLQPQES